MEYNFSFDLDSDKVELIDDNDLSNENLLLKEAHAYNQELENKAKQLLHELLRCQRDNQILKLENERLKEIAVIRNNQNEQRQRNSRVNSIQ